MAYPQGIDFRATSGYVTDPANCDYEIGLAVNYPRTTPVQGVVVGWESISSSLLTRDRNTGTPKLAGVVGFANALTADVGVYRMDLSASGLSWDFRIAVGDHDNQCQNQTIELFDNVTSVGVIVNNGDTLAPDKWFDATGVLRTSSADWIANNAPLTVTFASSILRIKFGPNGRGANTGGNTEVGHVFVQASASGATPGLPNVVDTAVQRACSW